MLKLQINDYNTILNNYQKLMEGSSEQRCLFELFFDYLHLGNNESYEKEILRIYRDGITELINDKLDYRNTVTNLDGVVDLLKDNEKSLSSIVYLPIKAQINYLYGKDIFSLDQHKNNIDGEAIDIEESEIMDAIFFLNSHKLFSDNIISKYVDSTSKYTLSQFKSLLGIELKDNLKVDDKDESPSDRYRLVFDEDLKVYQACNQGYDTLSNSLDEIIALIASDVKRIIQSNSLNIFYIRNYLHPYLEFYLLKIEHIIESDRPHKIRNLIKLMDSTLVVFNEYNHELTRYMLSVLYLVTKSSGVKYVETSSETNLLDTYRRKYLNKAVLRRESTSCEIFAMMKMIDFTVERFGGMGSKAKSLMDSLVRSSRENFDEIYQLTGLRGNSVNESVNENYGTDNRIEPMISQAITALNEAFEIRKDGTIKVVLKGRVSLMDEYAANHRLLKLNEQSNDVNSMKYNLVYALLIVESADRILHNPRVAQGSKKYQDAEKAKSFATNDIVTYLPKIKLRDKTFDLNAFYKKVRADEYTIEVDSVSTISGVKKIMKAILAK